MAGRELLQSECGGANPMVKMASHFSNDHAHRQLHHPPRQFSDVEASRMQVTPASFRMDGLLNELHEVEQERQRRAQTPVFTAPAVAELARASQWAAEFHKDDSQQISQTALAPRLHQPRTHAVMPAPLMTGHQGTWASDYLDKCTNDVGNPAKATDKTPTEKISEWLSNFEQGDTTASTVEPTNAVEKEDYFDSMRKTWDDLASQAHLERNETELHPWIADYEDVLDQYKEYKFSEENALKDHPDPFTEGKARLALGDIPNAVLLFEAAVLNNPDHAEAWQYLGTSQAENEQEGAAIAALKKCLESEPGNLTALMSLAVSYTNESLQGHACDTLRRWLQHNPAYSDLVPPEIKSEPSQLISFMTESQFSEVRDLFISAANRQQSNPDPDVQTGLGVLFNLSGDYNKAIDCFRAALSVRHDDSKLWNKLGATLANSRKSEEAITAYSRALELAPGFIRCRYNLGIACINLGANAEAAEHLLTCLHSQRSSRAPGAIPSHNLTSDSIWATLRLALTSLHQPNLLELVDQRNLDNLINHFGLVLG